MKRKIVLVLALAVILVLLNGASGCCKRCCSPSIEVGMSHPDSIMYGCGKKLEIWTWDPVTKFPRNPNLKITGSKLKPLRPYLAKALVTNYSDVEVRGVTVVFYWGSFGLFDRGTPIGAVAADIPADSSVWVSSPMSFTLGDTNVYHLCLSVRVFHPCDTELKNNYCWRNLTIEILPWPWKLYVVPFVVDFREIEGRMKLKIEAPDGIRARVVSKRLPMGTITAMPEARAIEELDVKREVPQELSLVIENAGADFQPGNTFDVTVTAMQNEKEVSSFSVTFQIKR